MKLELAGKKPSATIVILFVVISLILLAVAASQDRKVSQWVHDHNLQAKIRRAAWSKYLKWPGDFRFTLALGALVLICDKRKLVGVIQMLIAGVNAGLIYTIVKWIVGRTRPFPLNAAYVPPFESHPFPLGIQGLWKAGNMAFPSGHTCLAFAVATALTSIAPRGAVVYYLVAAVVGVERVLEGAHYPSDAVGGVVFGILSAYLAAILIRKMKPKEPEA